MLHFNVLFALSFPVSAVAKNFGAISKLHLVDASEGSGCPGDDWVHVTGDAPLDGNLNQGAPRGRKINLCAYPKASNQKPITNLTIRAFKSNVPHHIPVHHLPPPADAEKCSDGWSLVPADSSLGYDLNKDADTYDLDGRYLYLCERRDGPRPFTDLTLTEGECKDGWEAPDRDDSTDANYDCNQGVGGETIHICQRKACVVNFVKASWKFLGEITHPQSFAVEYGTSTEHDQSKTQTWTESLITTVSGGLHFGPAEDLAADVKLDVQHSTSVGSTVETSLKTVMSQKTSFAIPFTEKDVGRYLWQFTGSKIEDSCQHIEHSKFGKSPLSPTYQLTDRMEHEPCCLPNYFAPQSWDRAVDSYVCVDEGSKVPKTSKTVHCKVQGKMLHNAQPAGKCLDIDSSGDWSDGTKVQLWTCQGVRSQQWVMMENGQLKSTWIGRCLDIDTADQSKNGAKLQIWDCTGGPNQKWVFEGTRLRNPSSGKCVDIDSNGHNRDGTKVQLWDCNGQINQQLELIKNTDIPPQEAARTLV